MPFDLPVPDLEIRINGAALPPAAAADITTVEIEEDVDALSMFSIELVNWDATFLTYPWSESEVFRLGNELEIRLGYVDDLTPVMNGEITSVEPEFTADQPPMVTIRGFDRRHRMGRGTRTRTFSRMKDSAIASQLATEAGLRAVVKDSQTQLEYVVQNNQSDLEFLRSRARLIGYEVFVRDRTLYYQPPGFRDAPSAILMLGEELDEFRPRLTAMGQVGSSVVRGWDPQRKSVVAATAAASSLAGSMGPGPLGARAASRAFGAATTTRSAVTVRDRASAQQLADAGLLDTALSYVEGEASGVGNPALRAGSTVQIEGAGETFSGTYYVPAVRHSLNPESGYRTSFDVRRNAA